ncbi:hypothetical protein ACFVH0_00815 [Streptomyces sp. NPDC127117]|uniref:hypothetical protein n=1 Tax=Streptomyces sp. NPDC127117 TaxID=3345368 RepID=UPI00362E8113
MKFLPRPVAAALVACAALGVPLASQSASAANPTPVDRSIPRTDLPAARAFLDGKPADLAAAVAHCESGPNACTFTADKDSTFRYYDRARVAGDAFVNCTRNTAEHPRTLRYQEDAFDSVSQKRTGLFAHPVLARPENTGAMSHQLETALTQTGGAWTWTKSAVRDVTERIRPGEVSWIEVQPARHRVYGSFTATGTDAPDWRIDVIVDAPHAALPDRVLQRTGPMSEAEKQHCAANRPVN